MKKVQKFLISAFCVALGAGALIACGGTDDGGKDDGKVTVTFYDATGTNKPTEMTVVKTVTIDKNSTLTVGADGKVDGYTPTKEGGYEFVDWFATPSKSHKFDFSEEITEDTAVYGGFSKYVEDTREYYIIGAGTSSVLLDGWGVINSAHKFTKAEGKNEYSLTLDLKENDEFTLDASEKYEGKRGAGYLVKYALEDGTQVFAGQGSVYDDSTKGANIKVLHSGNYTLTLTTHPNEDYYNTAGDGYSEERKEIYNLNPYDTIDWERNGDVKQQTVVTTNIFIKGKNITGWADMVNDATKMKKDADTYTLEVYLAEGEQFMFASQNVSDGVTSAGSLTVKADALTEASKAYIDATDSKDMIAKASGTYTFTYDGAKKELSVAFDAQKAPAEYEYYLDGNIGGTNWGDYQAAKTNKLVKGNGTTYTLESVTLAAGEEFVIRAHAKDEEKLEWGNVKYQYNYLFLKPSTAFEQPDKGTNVKVKTAGTYDITFDSYSQMITIVEHTDSADTLDIYIKGTNINNWTHGWSADYRFKLSKDKTKYEYKLTVEDGKEVKFGMEKHPKGETTGYGDYLAVAALGTDGDANDNFKPASGSDLICSTAGTYKIVYTIATGKVDIYADTAE